MSMRVYRGGGEVTLFLVNLYVLEAMGPLIVKGILWLFRFFGIAQPWLWWYGCRDHKAWLDIILLAVAVLWSVCRILRKAKRRRVRKNSATQEDLSAEND